MDDGNGNGRGSRQELELVLERTARQAGNRARGNDGLHPAWETFIRYCQQLRHGELERLKIQDGLPVLAETITTKVKFS